jgi:hypothetical protein
MTTVFLKFHQRIHKGKNQMAARNGELDKLFIVDRQEKKPVGEGDIWLCEVVKQINSPESQIKAFTVKLIEQVPKTLTLKFTRFWIRQIGDFQWQSEYFLPTSGYSILFVIDRSVNFNNPSPDRVWNCDTGSIIGNTIITVKPEMPKLSPRAQRRHERKREEALNRETAA